MLWGEVVLCTTYIRNCFPSLVINNKTPYELWYNKIPNVKHFKVFGSTCYTLIPM